DTTPGFTVCAMALREALAFSPDGKWIASGSPDRGPVGVWDTTTGRATGVLDTQRYYLNDMAFLHDGRLLTFNADRTLRSWNPSQNEATIILRFSDPSIVGQLVSPDGTILMCAKGQNALLWDLTTSRKRADLPGPWVWGNCMAVFSADGRHLA